MQTLEELKKENAALPPVVEEAPEAEIEAVSVEETQPVAPETETPETVEKAPETTDTAWLQSEPDPEPKFTDSDVAAVRRKYQAKAAETAAENDQLRIELEELKKKVNSTPVTQPVSLANKPKRVDFEDEDEYIEALTDFKIKLAREQDNASTVVTEQQRKAQEQNQRVAESVDAHYTRAIKLAEKSGITPEAYHSADLNVRRSINDVFPGGGDLITDALISSLGEGSEKVFYNIGVNPSRRAKLTELLREDNSGIKAATFLGELKAQLNAPDKRVSAAPAPADQISGDVTNGNSKARDMREKYKKAHEKGDLQTAFNIKKDAKAAGHDVKSW